LGTNQYFYLQETRDPNNPDDVDDFDGWKAYFEIPHWMHLSYINYDEVGSQKVPHSSKYLNRTNIERDEMLCSYSHYIVAHRANPR
jgi:hypothetical protein